MNTTDLQHIFKKQLADKEPALYFLVVEDDHIQVLRHPADDLDGLVLVLDNFIFCNLPQDPMPRFAKQ